MSNNYLFMNPNQQIGKWADMNDLSRIIGANVARKRRAAGLSQAELASLIGVKSQNTIAAIETGRTRRSKELPRIAQVLKVSMTDLDPSFHGEETVTIPYSTESGEQLKVFASVEGGSGALVLSNEPYRRVPMPRPLIGVRGGYGVLVVGESMMPLIRPGYTVWVDPHKPALRDDICLFIHDEDGEFRATIKQYCGQTPDGWLVKRFSPKERKFTLPRREWPKCHVVVGADYGR